MSWQNWARTWSRVATITLILLGATHAQAPFPYANPATLQEIPVGNWAPPTNFSGETFDLRLASEGAWWGPDAGNGIYDRDLRLVVFKFTSLTLQLPPGETEHTIGFINHRTRCPVVFMVQNDLTIEAGVTLSLKGEVGGGSPSTFVSTEPGPGGFRGGPSISSSGFEGAGQGLEGGIYPQSFAGGSSYIPITCMPLVGGSGGRGNGGNAGSAGGGAILLAVGGTTTFSGSVDASGGPGVGQIQPGGGGAIRVISQGIDAEPLASGPHLDVTGNSAVGGSGKIRIETPGASLANLDPDLQASLALSGADTISVVTPLTDAQGRWRLWLEEGLEPGIRIVDIRSESDGYATNRLIDPLEVTGSFLQPDVVFSDLSPTTAVKVIVLTRGVPLGDIATVGLRLTPRRSEVQFQNRDGVVLVNLSSLPPLTVTGVPVPPSPGPNDLYWEFTLVPDTLNPTDPDFDQGVPLGYSAIQASMVLN